MEIDHTWEILEGPEEAVEAMRALQADGWLVFRETVPLSGQCGFRCIMQEQEAGKLVRREHSILWNVFDTELVPIVVDCRDERDLLAFVLQHGAHRSFDFFEYVDDDVGFVCYCRAHLRRSLVLRIADETLCDFSDDAMEFIYRFEDKPQDQ